jgi:hypothetical protein
MAYESAEHAGVMSVQIHYKANTEGALYQHTFGMEPGQSVTLSLSKKGVFTLESTVPLPDTAVVEADHPQ